MSLGAVLLGVVLIHLYVHLGIILSLYLAPVEHFSSGREYQFWPTSRTGRMVTVSAALVEFWAFYFFALTYPLGWVMPRRLALRPQPEPDDKRNVPVLLLHGYMMNRFCMAPLRLWLRAQGFRRIESIGLRRLHGPIESFARQLRDVVMRWEAETPGVGVHVVAHSMGGLVAASLLEDKVAGRHIRGIVAIGSPFGGSVLHCVGLGICARQFRPGGSFLKRLSESLLAGGGKKLVSIYSESDRLVLPPSNSYVPTALANERLIGLGHMSLLLAPRVFKIVRDHLLGLRGVVFSEPAANSQARGEGA